MPYKGQAKKLLDNHGIKEWDSIRVYLDDLEIEAVVLPGPETDRYIYLKLPNGYNIAYNVKRIKKLEKIGTIKPKYSLPSMKVTIREDLPQVSIIHCGGTIASRIEYSTGAVAPAFSSQELSNAIPEIFELGKISLRELLNIFSENFLPRYWIDMAKAISEEFLGGAEGVILTHGTDTLHFSAAAMAFMLENLPGPVVFTGAMRSSDRPASDSAVNLIASVKFAINAPIAESVVLMHGRPDDTLCLVYRGVRCIKIHSSRRDAFRSIGVKPLAKVDSGVKILTNVYIPRKDREYLTVRPYFEEKTALLYVYPGIAHQLIDILVDHHFRGIVIAGTGLGHAPEYIFPSIRRAIEEGVVIAMTTQCIWGGVYMNVYETGRLLKKMGVIPLHTMLPHVAYVKLGWLLGQGLADEDLKNVLMKNLRHELIPCEPLDCFFYDPIS